MARRVEDLILLMPLISGPDFRDAAIVPIPWRSPDNVTLAEAAHHFLHEQRRRGADTGNEGNRPQSCQHPREGRRSC